MQMNSPTPETIGLMNCLVECIGKENVSIVNEDCVLYAQDVFTKSIPAALVVTPSSTQDIAEIVRESTAANFAVIVRGGGMSYTKGYVPVEVNTVIINMAKMTDIIEINTEDMFVTVQAGCTWQALYQALKSTGYRTPYWGTLSGSKASVGGGISQNAIFWGSGQHGFAVDSVLGLEVVLADGEILQTGAGAHQRSSTFMRHYGPDLTGLFCCDNAALGIKSSVTLRLIPQMAHKGTLSFCFEQFEHQAQVMSEVARQNLASECFGFDPFLQAQRLKRESLASDVKSLVGVMKSAGGVGKGLKAGMKVALAGRRFVEAQSWSVHFMVEDLTQVGVEERLEKIRAIAAKVQGNEIENTIPQVLSANPFGPVNNMIGPNGERWAPIHTLVPHSKAKAAYQMTEEVVAAHQEAIEKYHIGIGYLVATVSSNVFVLEPVFFWPDALNELHKSAVEKSHLSRLTGFAPNPQALEAVSAIRQALVTAYNALGGVHMQIGKTYLFQQGLSTQNAELLSSIKAMLDPKNRLNPQVLGFHEHG